jgi:hypothetical protein
MTFNLKNIFNFSYVGWQNHLSSEEKADIRDYFQKNRTMRAFIQLKNAIEKLYGKGLELNEDTWHLFNQRIEEAYVNPNHELNVLKNICGYEKIILDDYINIRNSGSQGVKCDVALRCDFMFYGYNRQALLTSEAKPFDFFDDIPDNIDDYVQKIKLYIVESVDMKKCKTLKVCMAYFRDINFQITEKDKATLVYSEPQNALYIRYFQDYIMTSLCEIAEALDLPIQLHTGLGQIYGTSAMQLLPIIKKFNNVKFALLHGSFPWIEDLLAILYAFPNTYLDLCWMPQLSYEIAKKTLINALEITGTDRIMWGCDTATVEESYGALLAMSELLEEVNSFFIGKNIYDSSFGEELKAKILYNNANNLYEKKETKK